MKRRAAVEPTIGHLKSDYRLERNRLKGRVGDALNALFSAAAMNLKKLLGFFLAFASPALRPAPASSRDHLPVFSLKWRFSEPTISTTGIRYVFLNC